jgi:hypothetical protein
MNGRMDNIVSISISSLSTAIIVVVLFLWRYDVMDLDSVIWVTPYVVHAYICSVFCRKVAVSKGYSGADWALAGFFCGILALFAAGGLASRPQDTEVVDQNSN